MRCPGGPCAPKQPDRPFTVGYAGRLVPEKGVRDLLAAVCLLDPPVKTLLVGDGVLREELRATSLPNGDIEVRTGVGHDEMPLSYAEMDVLVLPSRTTRSWAEQFGRVLVEALWCGVPVVGSDSGEIPWVIETTHGGRVYPEGDIRGLAARLVELRREPRLAAKLSAAGRASVERTFGIEAVARALDRTLLSVLLTRQVGRHVAVPDLRRLLDTVAATSRCSVKFDFLVTGADDLNAIEHATTRLAQAVARAGHSVRVVPYGRGSLTSDSDQADVLVLPYNPFMWGRWGFAPTLVRDVAGIRRLRPRPLLVLVVHEPYVPVRSFESLAMGVWQRAQLAALVMLADRRFASIEPWARRLSRLRQTGHLPSGSNLPDARAARTATRAELGVGETLVVASLSTGHPSHLTSYVEASLADLSRRGFELTFLQLGAGSVDVVAPPRRSYHFTWESP